MLHPDLQVRASGRRDFDMKVVRVRGSVTVDGEVPAGRKTGDGASTGDIGQLAVVGSRPEVRSGNCGQCTCWGGHSQKVPLEKGEDGGRFAFLAFPGHYRMRTLLPAYLGGRHGGVYRAEALSDGPVRIDQSLHATRVTGRVTFSGWEPEPADRERQEIHVRTPYGEKGLKVDENGRVDGRILGRDPRVVFNNDDPSIDPRSWPPAGKILLRNRCADSAGRQQ